MFEIVIKAFRAVAERDALSLKEAVPATISVRVRRGFAVQASVVKWGDSWALSTSESDASEAGRPNFLEIVGSKWKLVRHAQGHSMAGGHRVVVAEGDVR